MYGLTGLTILSSKILNELGQVLPDSLECLNLELEIDPRNLKVFLEDCKRIMLNKLLIRNKNNEKVDVTFNL